VPVDYGTETGTGPEVNANGFYPDDGEKPGIQIITGAPDLKDFLKPKRTQQQREYEERTAAVLKQALIGTLNSGNARDAATIIRFGPAFARGTGHLADSNEKARATIHAMTTPGNPWMAFAMTGLPFVAQLIRNHENEIAEIPVKRKQAKAERKHRKETGAPKPEPRFRVKVPFTRFSIPLRFNVKLPALLAGFRTQTQEPDTLAESVFSDPKVLRALVDLGITIVNPPGYGPDEE
jgi:hypothetical protein